MQDVEETVSLMINLPCRMLSSAGDLVIQVLRCLASHLKSTPKERERRMRNISDIIPGMGKHGQISVKELRRYGEDLGLLEIPEDRGDLKELKKSLHKFGVDFAIIKKNNVPTDILFKAADYDCMTRAFNSVFKDLNLSEKDMKNLFRNDFALDDPDFEGTELNNVVWRTSVNDKGEPVAIAQVGPYDLEVNKKGNWSVSSCGKIESEGRAVDGTLLTGMLRASSSAHDLSNAQKLGCDITVGKGEVQSSNPAQAEHKKTVAGVARNAVERAAERQAKGRSRSTIKAKNRIANTKKAQRSAAVREAKRKVKGQSRSTTKAKNRIANTKKVQSRAR